MNLEKILYHMDFTNDLNNLKEVKNYHEYRQTGVRNTVKSILRGGTAGYFIAGAAYLTGNCLGIDIEQEINEFAYSGAEVGLFMDIFQYTVKSTIYLLKNKNCRKID